MTMNTKYLALLAAALLLPASVFAQESTATFIIEKIWNQGGDHTGHEVTAHLSCTGADTTQQNVVFTATTDAVLFVYDIIQVPDNQNVDCTVWETVPDNYTAAYECNDGPDCLDTAYQADWGKCFYPDVEYDGEYTCTIENTPEPAVVTVTKTWVIEGADQGFDGHHEIHASCDSTVYAFGGYNGGDSAGYEEDSAANGSTDYEFTIVEPKYPNTVCDFYEQDYDSVIDSDDGCGSLTKVSAGDESECEIVNTVFFEGIPTLSQYGMAILALLMLGVGFVGFRRFV